MKGIVFTEFLEMVESNFGADTADHMVEQCALSSGGAYTALGTYDHEEIVRMVKLLSNMTDIQVEELLKSFGRHLLKRFAVLYPGFFDECSDCYTFLDRVETTIHTEVYKLYPGSELPTFETSREGDGFVLVYRSARPFADLAEGLISGTIEHYGELVEIERQDLDPADGTAARFCLARRNVV